MIGQSAALDTIGKRTDSLALAEQALSEANKFNGRSALRLQALALNMKAQYLKENGENAKAHQMFQQIGDISKQLDDKELLLASLIGKLSVEDLFQVSVSLPILGKNDQDV